MNRTAKSIVSLGWRRGRACRWAIVGLCWIMAAWNCLAASPSFGQDQTHPRSDYFQRLQGTPTTPAPAPAPAGTNPVAQQRFNDIMDLLNRKAPPAPPPALKKFQVLCIGVDKYARVGPQLRGAVNDANDVALTFQETAQANGGHAVVEKLLDEKATAAAIKQSLANLSIQPRSSDCVVIYLAGHGDRARGVWRFIPHDFSPDAEDETSVSAKYILEAIKPLLARGQLVFLVIDACHAGQAFTQMQEYDRIGRFDFKPNGGLTDAKQNAGLILFAATVGCQSSREKVDESGRSHGRFTQAFTDAFLSREFDSDDANLTLRDLRDIVKWKMHLLDEYEHGDPLPGFSADQDCICEYSHFLSDTLPIRATATDTQRRFERITDVYFISKQVSEKLSTRRPFVDSPEPIVGIWKWSVPLTNADGSKIVNKKGEPIEAAYALEFKSDGEYVAAVSDGCGGGNSSYGHYTYQPGKFLELDYGAGVDRLSLYSLSHGSIEIGWDDMLLKEHRLTLQRVALQPGSGEVVR